MTRRGRGASRRVPTWGCGGVLTREHGVHGDRVLEAADDDLRRRVPPDAAGGGARERLAVLSRRRCATTSEIEPTFERYVYGPLARGVFRIADGMKVLQAGSLHAYLGYVIALVVSLVLMVWWRS